MELLGNNQEDFSSKQHCMLLQGSNDRYTTNMDCLFLTIDMCHHVLLLDILLKAGFRIEDSDTKSTSDSIDFSLNINQFEKGQLDNLA